MPYLWYQPVQLRSRLTPYIGVVKKALGRAKMNLGSILTSIVAWERGAGRNIGLGER